MNRKEKIFNSITKVVETILRFVLKHPKVPDPIQLPLITNEIKLEQFKLEKRLLFEEIENYRIPVADGIEQVKIAISIDLAEHIYKNDFGHIRVSKDELNQCYKVESKLYIGVDNELQQRIFRESKPLT